MKIRRYIAKDMREALAKVREAQGPDAVILSSRRSEEGVEVVAAIDFEAETVISKSVADEQAANRRSAAEASFQSAWRQDEVPDFAHTLKSTVRSAVMPDADDNADVGSELRTLRRMLESQLATLAWNDLTRRAPLQTALLKELSQFGFSHQLAVDVVSQIPARMEWLEAQRKALALISKRIPVIDERWLDQGGMVALIGPTGVGKTTMIAKLAARWVLRNGARDLALVSADSVRMGAQDQIQNLGRLLGVPTYGVDQLAELPNVLSAAARHRLVLVDTAGISQRDQRLSAELALLATSHPQLETSLVVSASAQAGSLEESFLRFTAAAPKTCCITKVDEATTLGGALSVLIRHTLPLMYVSEGQRIPEDMAPARAHQLVARAVDLARRCGAQTEEEVLTMKFGGVAHALA
jgi:flagellar biosynthesis protein FlhF